MWVGICASSVNVQILPFLKCYSIAIVTIKLMPNGKIMANFVLFFTLQIEIKLSAYSNDFLLLLPPSDIPNQTY